MCHCAATCHQTFGGIRSFDRHRNGGVCGDPVALGLRWNAPRRCWSEPYSWQRAGADRPAEHVLHAYAETLKEPTEPPPALAPVIDDTETHVGVDATTEGFHETWWYERQSKDW